ncbi:MAG: FlgD immunoglobulin-like domain containing protein, partial [bacterium]
FRVIGAGDPRIGLASVDARDAANTRVEVGMKLALPGRETASVDRTELLPNIPNPFNPMTKVAFRLAQRGEASLSIFTADGRRVKLLAQGSRAAGLHEFVWDGRDDHGADVSSAIYYTRLETVDGTMSRPLTLIR